MTLGLVQSGSTSSEAGLFTFCRFCANVMTPIVKSHSVYGSIATQTVASSAAPARRGGGRSGLASAVAARKVMQDSGSCSIVLKCRACDHEQPVQSEGRASEYSVTLSSRGGVSDLSVDQTAPTGSQDDWKNVATTTIKCPAHSCSGSVAYFRQMQIRSADEAMTTFYKCKSCGHEWKED